MEQPAGHKLNSGPVGKWRILLILAFAELLAMAVWFSASAVVKPLAAEWSLGAAGKAWLTMSVQVGFVSGALLSTLLNLADRVSSKWLFAASAWLAASCTAAIPLAATNPWVAIAFRFVTGFALAGVYPVSMKIIATWTKTDRGIGIGLIVAAISVGSALPQLLNFSGGLEDWRFSLFAAALLAAMGGLLGVLFVKEGPYATKTPPFNWKYVANIAKNRNVVLANLGYLGHMWELYAVWTWLPAFLAASFSLSGIDSKWAAMIGFAVIAAGGVGSLLAGWLADKLGRTLIIMISLAISGACCLTCGLLFGGNPVLLTVLCLIWGVAVVADSAQFSASVSELSEPEYIGTALTVQTSLGFLLTLLTIRLVPTLEAWVGWENAFVFLSLGPIAGLVATWMLRNAPESSKLAGGRK